MKERRVADRRNWMSNTWRPAMGWVYMAICIFDFIIAPILWSAAQIWIKSSAGGMFQQWSPLTLQGAGLFHMAMGAILGVAAWGRTREKINGVMPRNDYDHDYNQQFNSAPPIRPYVAPPPRDE